MFIKPQGFFEVEPLPATIEPIKSSLPVASSWSDYWQTDPVKKRQFGEALNQHSNPFNAALVVYSDTSKALWVSKNWIDDDIVLEAKQTVEEQEKILDKDALCHKLITICEEKSPQGYYTVDPEVKLKYLELYAKIQGYIGKVEQNTTNNFTNNALKVVFVRPNNNNEKPPATIIDQNDPEIKNPLRIKLVSSS